MDAAEQAQRRALGRRLRIIAVALMASLAALIAATWSFKNQVRLVQQAIVEEGRLNLWQTHVQAILADLSDAETGQRGYLLTGKRRYLAPYHSAAEHLPRMLQDLDAIPVAMPALSGQIRDIRTQTYLKLTELAETIRLHDQTEPEAALAVVQTDVGERYMERLRSDIKATLNAIRSDRQRISSKVLAGSIATEHSAFAAVSALVITVILAALEITTLMAARSRYELALAVSEQKHRTIVEEQTEFIALSRPDGSLTYVNGAYREFFQLPLDIVAKHSLYDAVVPEDGDLMRHHITAVLKTGAPTAIETRAVTADKLQKWIAWRHRVQRGPNGEGVIHSIGRDITQRKSAEDALRASERRLEASERFIRTITDNVPVRLGYFDKEQRFQFVNQALCTRFATKREDLIGRTVTETAALAGMRQVSERLAPAADGRLQRFEYTEDFNDSRRRIETYLIPDLAATGEVRGIIWVGVDISRLKSTENALRHLTEVFENTSDFVAQTDWRGQVQFLNPAVRRAVGFSASQPLTGHMFSEFLTAETNARWMTEIIPIVKQNGVWVGETSVVLQAQRVIPVSHIIVAHRDMEGRIARYSSVMRDISSEVANRAELARQTATLDSIIEAIPAMVAVWDVDVRYRLVNKAFERWRGKSRAEVIGKTLEEVVAESEYLVSLPWVKRALAGETVSFEKEYPTARESRHVTVTYMPLQYEDGSVGGFIGIAQDITLHREENIRLLLLSERDPLTGLLNRAGFERYLSSKVVQGHGASIALLFIDLDHFKPINDTYGHAIGDDVLREFAARLQAIVRPTDAVARLGGDEFVVVLAGVREPEDAVKVADKIVGMAKEPLQLDNKIMTIGASVGVAFNADAEGGWKGLVARADAMAYSAKAGGRGRSALTQNDLSEPVDNGQQRAATARTSEVEV